MKKILLLGGSAQQVVAVETAKRLGYYTVLCDYLPDNPGQHVADKFYLVSTTDMEAVLQVAKEEQVDGVLAYASDPAAPTAAYVAQELHLPGNPYVSVETLCNKDKFRLFLQENGFSTPFSKGYTSYEEVVSDIDKYSFPIMIKPVDSSGSKGITVLQCVNQLEDAVSFALDYSRGKRIIVEEFIEKKHKYLIGGDIFVVNGKVILWGLLNCHRDTSVNPLVPVGKSYPIQLNREDIEKVKKVLSDMVHRLDIQNGAMNVELVIDKNNRVFPIDIGPRSGGNMIPDLLGDIFGVDIVEMSVRAAMGSSINANIQASDMCFATQNLHSDKAGIYVDVEFATELQPYIYRKYLYNRAGDKVEYFDNAAKCLGIVFMKFPNADVLEEYMSKMKELIIVNVQ